MANSAGATGEEGIPCGRDLITQPLVNEFLTAEVTALLPEDWRHEVRVVQLSDGFAMGFRDAEGMNHGLEARGPATDQQPFVQGRCFSFHYLRLNNSPEVQETIARYRKVLENFRGKEDLLERALRQSPSDS